MKNEVNETKKRNLRPDLTQEEIQALFRYDPETGQLWWREGGRGRRSIVRPAGTDLSGYTAITHDGKRLLAHRLVWILHNGPIPKGLTIDHKNLDRGDNRIENLRLATYSQQGHNRARWNKASLKGVYSTPFGKIVSKINHGKKLIHLGTFQTEQAAHEAWVAAAKAVRGEFFRAS